MTKEPALSQLMEWRRTSYASFDGVQQLLKEYGPDVIFVDWFHTDWLRDVSGMNIYIHVHRLDHYTVPMPIKGLLMQDVKHWLELVMIPQSPLDTTLEGVAQLSKLSPFIEYLALMTSPGETIVMCPTGPLHRVPFHALSISGQRLIQRNPTVYC